MRFPAVAIAGLLASCLTTSLDALGQGLQTASAGPKSAFFALSSGVKDATHATPDSQVKLLRELGYDDATARQRAVMFRKQARALPKGVRVRSQP